jgi:hypothetical protein
MRWECNLRQSDEQAMECKSGAQVNEHSHFMKAMPVSRSDKDENASRKDADEADEASQLRRPSMLHWKIIH